MSIPSHTLQAAHAALTRNDPAEGLRLLNAAGGKLTGDAAFIAGLCHDRLGETARAAAAFGAARQTATNPGQVLKAHASMLHRAGNSEIAIQLATEWTWAEPDEPDSHFTLATIYDQAGQFPEAEAAYRTVLSLDPDHVMALSNLGHVLNQMDRPAEALQVLEKADQSRPDHPNTLSYIADSQFRLGDPLKAAQNYRAALQRLPDNPVLLSGLARATATAGQGAAALDIYNRAIVADPGEVGVHRDFNRLLWEMGRRDTFLKSIDWAMGQVEEARAAELAFAKGDLARLAGQSEVARQAYDRAAIAADPALRARALSGRAQLADLAGQPATALPDHEAAFGLATDQPDIRHAYAETLLALADYTKAISVLDVEVGSRHLQKHIALKALAYRLNGDERYLGWYDYDRFTAMRELPCPDFFSSLPVFLSAIEEELEPLFETAEAPIDQTLFNGVQSPGDLWDTKTPAIQALRSTLFQTVDKFVADLPRDAQNPFTAPLVRLDDGARHLTLNGGWAVKLRSGGGHVDHIHPDGWISTANYIRVPDLPGEKDNSRGGWLRLGASGVRGVNLPAERYIRPEAGCLIMFPSYMWHGVEPFSANEPRITTPFDVLMT